MRILMLSWEYPPRIVGGISRVVHDLAQKLGEAGNEVHVVTCWEPGTEEIQRDEFVLVHRVHTYELNAGNFIDWVMQLNFALIEYSIMLLNQLGGADIIHAHDWVVAFAARTLKHGFLIPMVSTIHATEAGRNQGIHDDTQRYIHNVEWWLVFESWKIIVNSDYMRNEVMTQFQAPEDKIFVIPNGVDRDKFKGYERDNGFRRRYAGDNEKIVFFVGRLVNEKGAHILVESIPKVVSHYHDVKFVVAGKGPQLDYIRRKSAALNIADKVYFTGYLSDNDLNRMYKCCDIAVFPSLYEPFGIVALEGMVAGVPVVASDTGGFDEIISHGIDGMKSYTGNPNSLADCILELLFNPEKAEEIKRKALEQVYNVYNWDIISKKTMEVYWRILDERMKSGWTSPDLKEYLDR